MGRKFWCSDNYFDLGMGSQRCREVRPGQIPAWKQWQQQQTNVWEGYSSEDDNIDSINNDTYVNESPTTTIVAGTVPATGTDNNDSGCNHNE